MPLSITTGWSQKIGTANYGSVGATCNVSFEAGHDLLESDLAAFHQKVKNAFTACRQAVQDELARAQQPVSAAPSNDDAAQGSNGNGHPNGNGRRRSSGRKATASQVRAIHAIASRQGLDLVAILRERFGSDHPEDLAIAEASELIDELKSATNGSGRR